MSSTDLSYHDWIDYVFDPEHNAIETEFTYYGSPVKRDP